MYGTVRDRETHEEFALACEKARDAIAPVNSGREISDSEAKARVALKSAADSARADARMNGYQSSEKD